MMKKIKFSKNSAKKITSAVLKHRYLLFFIFFSAFLAYTFGFINKYIYANINYLEYEESYDSQVMLRIKTNDRLVKEILKNIEQRSERLQKESKDYNNPFKFTDFGISKTNKEIDNTENVENIDNIDNTGNIDDIDNAISNNESNNLITPPFLNTP